MIGDDAVVVDAEQGAGAVITATGEQLELTAVPAGAVLAQPAPKGTPVVAVGADGTIVQAAPTGGPMAAIGSAGGSGPVAPIVHEGCTYAVVAAPPTLTRTCAGVVDQTTPLDGVSGAALRLRLVNGWIWVNDLDTGAAWVTTNDEEVQRVDEWGNNVSQRDGEGDEEQSDDGTGQDQENPDADDAVFKRADQIDEDGINQPPVARDDTAAHAGRPAGDRPRPRQRRGPRRRRAAGQQPRRRPGRRPGDADVGPHRGAGDAGGRVHRRPDLRVHDHRRPRRRGVGAASPSPSPRTTGPTTGRR